MTWMWALLIVTLLKMVAEVLAVVLPIYPVVYALGSVLQYGCAVMVITLWLVQKVGAITAPACSCPELV